VQQNAKSQVPQELEALIEGIRHFQELSPDRQEAILDKVLLWLWFDQQMLVSSENRDARAQTESSSQEKTLAMYNLLSALVHRLNSPLALIRVRSILTQDRYADVLANYPTIQNSFRQIQEVASEAMEMVAELRKELPGTVAVEVDVNKLINSTLSSIAIPEAIQLKLTLAPTPLITAASNALQSVFANIIANAIEAMPDGGTVTIESAQHGSHIEVRIRDTGLGIPREWLQSVFSETLSTKGEGHGLGLWWSRKYLEQFGGTIEVQSEVGKGTEFAVRLPARQGEW
jgi:signal transduction histidine kinase